MAQNDVWHDSEARKNVENVFNEETIEALFDLSDDGHFDELHGIVKDGKESKVCVAEKTSRDGGSTFLAAKIYTIEASNYANMRQYLFGDPRFRGIKRDRRNIIFNWCKKEFKNLQKARNIGLNAPEPVAYEDNVLLMAFLGKQFQPAPRLNEIELANPETALDELVDAMDRLWNDEEMVHGDLSAFNVLIWQGKVYLIDFSQAVLTHHPRAEELLERDIENVLRHFQKTYGIDRDPDEIIDTITA
jgi:RIO kinase 1